MEYFQTNIIDPSIKIVSLSDIHGDIQAFIIALRDCSKVIKKKGNFSQDHYDIDLENELLKDLNSYEEYVELYDSSGNYDSSDNYDFDDHYKNDLNYEWIGGNTHVVICGDIIDPFRSKKCKKTNPHTHAVDECSFYPQIELKILLFINAINKQALKQGGKIIKLLGNHELANILNDYNSQYISSTYSNPKDQIGTYYKGVSRMKIFNVGNYGFNLLFQKGCGLLVKINNKLFVHGGITNKSYNDYNNLNQELNDPSFHRSDKQNDWNSKYGDLSSSLEPEKSELWIRSLGLPEDASSRIENNTSDAFCTDLISLFTAFKGDGSVITEDPNDLILVVGHCVQSDLSVHQGNYGLNTGITYDHLKYEDNVSTIYSQDSVYTGKSVFDDRSKIFGITMECAKDNSHRIYRVDIGSSRGFDSFNTIDGVSKINNIPDENKFLFSKTPQVLVFNSDNTIDIIKSKVKNTRIHLPRPAYEASIITGSDLDINIPDNPNYLNKYLKYKNKYL